MLYVYVQIFDVMDNVGKFFIIKHGESWSQQTNFCS